MPRRIALLFALAAIGCNGPMGLLPGGALEGESSPGPADANWAFLGDYGTAQLETLPDEPYSVNLAYTVVDGRLYINAGDTETRWVQNMRENPRVRLRIDGVVYDLLAERVSERAEIERFAKAWTAQSYFRRDPSELEPVWIYRLSQRGARTQR